ncbi:hypothetical protein D6856_02610 [Butyrivibrio sp. XB500-5]|uniref:hypothetical protein n=1 Tax=Butyrivibrio sp. XB500-5 TaxID=2364880 RepID=UPI000EA99BFA|nr:hypothetical protein [Butyrivibrio sp. XB500-5]RKM63032.1 hypothetical protein D6856_02610 [Butyrivibrio sp. XB500-5]
MGELEELYFQKENEKIVRNELGKGQWIQVSGKKIINHADATFWCGLVKVDKVDTVFRDVGWDIDNRIGYPGFLYDEGDDSQYYKNCNEDEGKEALLYERDYYGIKPSTIEVAEEFRLINNLYYEENDKSYYSIKEDGQCDQAVRIEGNAVFIKLNYLMRYIAAKQMALVLFFDIRFEVKGSLEENGLKEFYGKDIKEKNIFYSINGGELSFPRKSFSRLLGKKVFMPRDKKTCGYWPFEKERKYVDYIIGSDEYGEPITFNSNPDKLGNYFGGNPTAPHYLTPVFFKKDVLHKYMSEPSRFTIKDGYLSCGYLWGLSIDVDHKDYVMVYLGDLGRDLPECEQDHWKSYNVLTDEKISKSSFMRDFMNVASSPEIADVKFRNKYKSLNDKWEKELDWPLFNPLADGDEYNLENIRIPLSQSQEEFDQQVLALNKTLVDSLNEKKIGKDITLQDGMKGISKLEEWLRNKNCNGFEKHISFLRDLQELRSAGTGHRKGKGYIKISEKFGLSDTDKKSDFEGILKEAIAFLDYMESILESIA